MGTLYDPKKIIHNIFYITLIFHALVFFKCYKYLGKFCFFFFTLLDLLPTKYILHNLKLW